MPLFDAIQRDRPERVVGVGQMLLPNSSALYELEDVRGYESMTLRALYETYPLWCVPQAAWYNRVDDLEKPFLSFLNVRYAIVPRGYRVPPGGPGSRRFRRRAPGERPCSARLRSGAR
jgi:hypothetical protein